MRREEKKDRGRKDGNGKNEIDRCEQISCGEKSCSQDGIRSQAQTRELKIDNNENKTIGKHTKVGNKERVGKQKHANDRSYPTSDVTTEPKRNKRKANTRKNNKQTL